MNKETERLRIRTFQEKDLEEMHAIFVQPEIMRLVGMAPAHVSKEQSRERLERWIRYGMHHAIVLKETEAVIGYLLIKPGEKEREKELGCALHPHYQRKGYMTETFQAVLKELSKEGIQLVWACCFKENTASRRLIEGCGFQFQKEGSYTTEEGVACTSLEYAIRLGKEVSQQEKEK